MNEQTGMYRHLEAGCLPYAALVSTAVHKCVPNITPSRIYYFQNLPTYVLRLLCTRKTQISHILLQ